MNKQHKIYSRNIIAILWGGIIAAGLAYFSIYFGAFLRFSDAPISKAQAFISGAIMLIGPIASSFIGGYITARTGINKERLIAMLSGALPFMTFLVIIDFQLSVLLEDIIFSLGLLLMIPFAWLGGYVYTRYKV